MKTESDHNSYLHFFEECPTLGADKFFPIPKMETKKNSFIGDISID